MTVETMWTEYLKCIGESVIATSKTYEAWHFCNNEIDANHLADLTRRGIKRATASLMKSYELENEPLPKVKDLNIVTYYDGTAACIIEVTNVKIVPFHEITEEDAKVEGEGDGSLAYWREGHLKFFNEEAEVNNYEFKETDLVVFMTFEVIYKLRKSDN
jgi:uncharacterized protein YhfF